MGIKTFKPTTPTLRYKSVSDFADITTDKPYKALTKGLNKKSGRNSQGRITVRHRGGGHKRKYRIIDFKRNKYNIEAKVVSIEYDPNRSSRIALLSYKDGEKRYIIAPNNLKVGDTVISAEKTPVQPGNTMPLKNIPMGIDIHNIELKKGKGGQIVRAAGTAAQIVAKEGKYCQIKLPSGEIRKVLKECVATIGRVGNIDNFNIVIGKAGRNRWLGKRPGVRGIAMNPIDHPHGGGEGRSKGYKTAMTPWGKPTKGYKTRDKKKASNKYIVNRRTK